MAHPALFSVVVALLDQIPTPAARAAMLSAP